MDQPLTAAPSTPPAPVSNVPETKPPASNHTSIIFVVLVSVVIGLLVGFAAFAAWQRAMAPKMANPSTNTPNLNTSSTSVTATSTSAATSTNDTTTTLLNVEWKTGMIVEPSAAFGSIITSNTVHDTQYSDPLEGMGEATPKNSTYNFYDQGRVVSAPYQDYRVIGAVLLYEPSLMMDLERTPRYINLLVSPDKQTVLVLTATTSQILAADWPRATFGSNIKLQLREFPQTLTLENGKTLRSASVSVGAEPSPLCGASGCVDKLPIAKTNDGYNIYVAPVGSFLGTAAPQPGCVVLYRENGEGMVYESAITAAIPDPKIAPSEDYAIPKLVTADQINWNAAYASTSTFRAHEIGGCGGVDCVRIATSDELKDSDLVQAGTLKSGEPIYVIATPVNAGNPHLLIRNVYESWYEYDPQTNEKPPIGVFLSRVKVPLFVWKDAFGRWVIYKNTVVVPLAECGKPVIYLYPTKTENVHVKLPSFINVTVSEPTYPKQGWNVSAEPSGVLTMPDGQKVGSLFWEGLGANYAVPKTGFIVKDGEVASFMAQTLPKYGLNATEMKDFTDFWLPHMIGATHYRVSFLTDEWNQSVPLNVSPAPKTTIRLFMDWQRLAGPIELEKPTIKTPTRNGFTLVEWGGLLR